MNRNGVFDYEDPFRPIYEYHAVAVWAACAVSLLLLRHQMHFGDKVLWSLLGVCLLMLALRCHSAWRIWRVQRHLGGRKLSFITRGELAKLQKGHENELFIGYGFTWTQHEVQLCHSIARIDPERLTTDDGHEEMGQPWLHGIGEEHEQPIYLPLDHMAGHLLLVGTTRSGKTRILDLIITQAVSRGETVVIFDPKGDVGLRNAAQFACDAIGQPDRFVYFHPAFPEKSVRIDPLKNFSRASELASRIAALIPSETGSDPFTAHSMMILNNLCEGLLMIDTKPSLKLLKRFVDGGPEWLLVRCYESHFDKHVEKWREEAKGFVEKAKAVGKGRNDRTLAIAYDQFYREAVQMKHPNSTLESLFADFSHDREHQQKMTASLTPVLTMLTSGAIGGLLSPDPADFKDTRPITDFARIIRNCQVAYIGLDTLSDNMVGSAIGSMFLADLTAVSGDRYNYGDGKGIAGDDPLGALKRVTVIVDEAAEVVSDKMIQLLNKAGGSLIQIVIATQTFADFAARVGSPDKARMVLGNLNNKLILRTVDGETQEYLSDSFPLTYVRHMEYSRSTDAKSSSVLQFGTRVQESMKETEVPFLEPGVLGCVPSLEFFAQVSGGRIKKVRVPILKSERERGPVTRRPAWLKDAG